MILGLSGCNATEDEYSDGYEVSAREKNLNLQAPSGQYIAENISHLKRMLAPIIEQGNWESKDYEIVSIQYDSLTIGLSAEIEYITEDGIESNIIITSGENTFVSKIKTRSEDGSEGDGGYVSYSCKKRNNNKCQKCRVINDKKNNQVRCACDEGLVEGCALYEYKY